MNPFDEILGKGYPLGKKGKYLLFYNLPQLCHASTKLPHMWFFDTVKLAFDYFSYLNNKNKNKPWVFVVCIAFESILSHLQFGFGFE
jgi:hypothetical protein